MIPPSPPLVRPSPCRISTKLEESERDAHHAGDKALSFQASRCIDALAHKSSRRECYVNVRVETRKHRRAIVEMWAQIAAGFSAARKYNIRPSCIATHFFSPHSRHFVHCDITRSVRRAAAPRLYTSYIYMLSETNKSIVPLIIYKMINKGYREINREKAFSSICNYIGWNNSICNCIATKRIIRYQFTL